MEHSSNGILPKITFAVGRACEYFTSAMILCTMLLITIQVILRFFNMPLFGIEELLQFPTIWIYMIGGICASFTKGHIECGVLETFIKSPRVLAVLAAVKGVVTAAIAIYAVTWGITYGSYSINMGKTSAILGIPMMLGELTITVGLIVMAAYTVLDAVNGILALRNGSAAEGEVE